MEEQNIQKYIKQVREDANKDIEKYLGSLNESNQEILKGLDDKFVLQDMRFDRIDKKLDEHTKILESHTEMIVEVKEDIETIKENLNKKADKAELIALKEELA